jgi:uncharacterized repeat protein (TIGR01451 family)
VVSPGEVLTYTLSIRNTGPRLLSGAVLSNSVPLSTTFVPGSLQGPAVYDPPGNQVTWNGPLAPGQTVTVSYRVEIDAALPAGSIVQNVARLSDESGLALERTAASRIDSPYLAGSAKTASSREATPGQILTYSLYLRNDGRQPAEADLIDPIPLRTSYQPGSGWASSGSLEAIDQSLHWTGTILPGQVVTVTFPVTIAPEAIGLYVYNRASLASTGQDPLPLETYTWVQARLFLPLILK